MKYTKDHPPRPGDKVRLNDIGLHIIGGLKNTEEIDALNSIRIKEVYYDTELTDKNGDIYWAIELTKPFNIYMLTSNGVDKV
mgnify:CR=1 FL=1|jgi:hypothetical protein